jgi:hypothetical protein
LSESTVSEPVVQATPQHGLTGLRRLGGNSAAETGAFDDLLGGARVAERKKGRRTETYSNNLPGMTPSEVSPVSTIRSR